MKLRSFRYRLGEGFRNIWSHRLMSIASAGVLIACMLMIGIVSVITMNIESYVTDIGEENVIWVFFDDTMTREEAIETTNKIAGQNNIKEAIFVPREEGLERQKKVMGEDYAPLFDWVSAENPLPDGCQVTMSNLNQFDKTVLQLRSTDGVTHVRQHRELASKLSAMRDIVRNIGVAVVILLMIIALMIVSNTIKITMYTRKLEINIMKAVGATDRFIRLPFIIEGMILGIVAGLASTGLLYFLYKLAEKTLAQGLGNGNSFVPFTDFALPMMIAFVVIGSVIGSLGSVISIGKYLRHEGSEFNAIT